MNREKDVDAKPDALQYSSHVFIVIKQVRYKVYRLIFLGSVRLLNTLSNPVNPRKAVETNFSKPIYLFGFNVHEEHLWTIAKIDY